MLANYETVTTETAESISSDSNTTKEHPVDAAHKQDINHPVCGLLMICDAAENHSDNNETTNGDITNEVEEMRLAKRQKRDRACTRCKARHKACDSFRPCNSCDSSNSECVDEKPSIHRDLTPTQEYYHNPMQAHQHTSRMVSGIPYYRGQRADSYPPPVQGTHPNHHRFPPHHQPYPTQRQQMYARHRGGFNYARPVFQYRSVQLPPNPQHPQNIHPQQRVIYNPQPFLPNQQQRPANITTQQKNHPNFPQQQQTQPLVHNQTLPRQPKPHTTTKTLSVFLNQKGIFTKIIGDIKELWGISSRDMLSAQVAFEDLVLQGEDREWVKSWFGEKKDGLTNVRIIHIFNAKAYDVFKVSFVAVKMFEWSEEKKEVLESKYINANIRRAIL